MGTRAAHKAQAPRNTTMLDLVTAVAETADTETELIATVAYMVNSGKVRLCGNFKGATFDLSDLGRSTRQAAA